MAYGFWTVTDVRTDKELAACNEEERRTGHYQEESNALTRMRDLLNEYDLQIIEWAHQSMTIGRDGVPFFVLSFASFADWS